MNKGLDGGGDDGFGWEPYCNENKLGIPHKFAGNRAPSGAKRARIEVEPATNGGTIQFSVIWLDGNNREISGANHLRNCTIDLGKNYNMNNFFRFASLVPWPETTSTNDGTYMLGGGFDSVKLGSYNWGISTSLVSNAWIIHHPKCQLPYGYWDTGEEFRIDHWA